MQNDDFIGQRFGKDGQVEVVGWSGKKSGCGEKLYDIKCHECAKDPELFGLAEYVSSKFHLKEGKLLCGCSPSPRYSESQTMLMLRRVSQDKYNIKGFVGNFTGSKSKIDVGCNTCGHSWNTTTASAFLRGTGCVVCALVQRGIEHRVPDDQMIAKFKRHDHFKDSQFWRSDRKNTLGTKDFWQHTCPVCSSDEYVANGLCSGVFEAATGDLHKGNRACRCGKNYRWTKLQREFAIRKMLHNEGGKYSFVGWTTDSHHSNSKITLNCVDHGNWNVSLKNALHNKRRCPTCSKTGYDSKKTGFVYIMDIGGSQGSFTGYGISNKWSQRVGQHGVKLRKKDFSIGVVQVFQTSGYAAQDIERLLKSQFPIVDQFVEGFRTEATHSYLYSDVVAFVKEKLEKLDSAPTTQ
jgi:RNA polymerase subunit RPABC4/transcription elongation factor Spt4